MYGGQEGTSADSSCAEAVARPLAPPLPRRQRHIAAGAESLGRILDALGKFVEERILPFGRLEQMLKDIFNDCAFADPEGRAAQRHTKGPASLCAYVASSVHARIAVSTIRSNSFLVAPVDA